MKRVLLFSLCMLILLELAGCGEKRSNALENNISEERIDNGIEYQSTDEKLDKVETSNELKTDNEDENMKLYFNDTEISVIWEDNQTVQELMNEVSKGDIIVQMSMYSDNEQVGSLGKSYTSADKHTTTHNGDIVLYDGDKIVVFYGANAWSYTKIGRMDIPESDVIKLLSNGDIILKITIDK